MIRFTKYLKKYMLLLLMAAMILLPMVGCGLKGGQDMNNELEMWQGQWFDTNGNTVLEIKGDKLTMKKGTYSETYTIYLKTEGSTQSLANKNGESFDFITPLTIRSDGTLMAYEMILDASGHTYHFVREEQLQAEREVVDVSRDMPKTIESTDIREFSLNFSTTNGRDYGLDDKWKGASYGWTIDKQDDGTYQMHFSQGYDSYMGIRFDGEVSAEFVKGLADKINELGLPGLNGYSVKNSVSLPGYGLYVTYESDERLMISASGNGADTCVFDLKALMDYVFPVVDTEN